jgi:FkbM family methyltransferase
MPLSNRDKTRFANVLFRLPLPLTAWSQLEKLSAVAQGKGWGMSSINEETSACLTILKKPPLIFADIGANKGQYTHSLLQRSHGSRCYLFEPANINVEYLRRRFAANNNVTVMGFALSDLQGSAILRSDSPGSGTASIVEATEPMQQKETILEMIETKRMDRIWDALEWPNPERILDLAKIDVEGYELAVLTGFGDKISSTRMIQFEYGSRNADTRTYFRDFWSFFTQHGFTLYRITPKGPQLIHKYSVWDESMVTTNFIALNRLLQGLAPATGLRSRCEP